MPPRAPPRMAPQAPRHSPAQVSVEDESSDVDMDHFQTQSPFVRPGQPSQQGSDLLGGHQANDEAEIEDPHEEAGLDVPAEEAAVSPLPPSGLKDISSLASWTVSTSKPGCGVAALRHPDTDLFWQSDGPQPHLLSIHFFKLVSIVYMRMFLDFENDESYTPTRMQFWAGMGSHDMQQFAEMTFEQPRGWIDVDFSNVGPIGDEDAAVNGEVDWTRRPVLRAFVVQVRIIENHQNGKDTHLRGLQIFARDLAAVPLQSARILSPRKAPMAKSKSTSKTSFLDEYPLRKSPWMMEPELR